MEHVSGATDADSHMVITIIRVIIIIKVLHHPHQVMVMYLIKEEFERV